MTWRRISAGLYVVGSIEEASRLLFGGAPPGFGSGTSGEASVWDCPSCTFQNAVGNATCDVCDSAKPGSGGGGGGGGSGGGGGGGGGRSLHSFTSQLNLSRFCHEVHPYPPVYPQKSPKQSLDAPPVPQKARKLSCKVDECKPLGGGGGGGGGGGKKGKKGKGTTISLTAVGGAGFVGGFDALQPQGRGNAWGA